MKIVVDINHPAHVHYFKHLIWNLERNGHQVLVTASDKDIAKNLLDLYNIPYVLLGSYGQGILRKVVNLPILDFKMWKAVRDFSPDVLIGFGSIRVAHVGRLLKKRTIILDDTEHAVLGQLLYRPFADTILTPACFQKDFGKKQQRFNGTTDLLYLHPHRFTPNPCVLDELGLTPEDTFFIVRFISWDANHDIGHCGISDRVGFVKEMTKYGRVFITSENRLPDELQQYQVTISPEKIHDLLYYATLFAGESGTMATEAACLGTHAVMINSEYGVQENGEYTAGVHKLFVKYGLLDAYRTDYGVFSKISELLNDSKLKLRSRTQAALFVSEHEDGTCVLMDSIISYDKP